MQRNKTFHLEKQNHSPTKHRQHLQQQQRPPPPPVPAHGQQASSPNEGLTLDLKDFRKPGEKTFTQCSCLFVGHLPPDITEEGMRKLFEVEGKADEVCIHRIGLWLYLLGNTNPSRGYRSRAGSRATPWRAAAHALCLR